MTNPLLEPIQIGPLELPNRVFMAPLTRGRAQADATPTAIMPRYYAQRAGAGLIVSEATAISPQGVGWPKAPGIFKDSHVEAWKPVTEAVHNAGGHIFLQLWHMGRASHPDFHGGELPVSASAIAIRNGHAHTPNGKKPYAVPRALEASELPGVAEDYAKAARRAIAAGFDGVEVHGANGYLIDQFIRDGSNQRGDEFGGSIENRWRFPLMVLRAVADEIGAGRTGVRFSPTGPFNDMRDSDPAATYAHGARELNKLGLAYVHFMEALPGHPFAGEQEPVHPGFRKVWKGAFILNGGYDDKLGAQALESGAADAIAFGVPFIANPDLPERYRLGAPLNPPDPSTFYTDGEKGYIDYPALAESAPAAS